MVAADKCMGHFERRHILLFAIRGLNFLQLIFVRVFAQMLHVFSRKLVAAALGFAQGVSVARGVLGRLRCQTLLEQVILQL